MIQISKQIALADHEIVVRPMRAQGAGGQNVNKVSSAVMVFFDIRRSSLPPLYKERLLQRADRRISKEGVVVIRAQQHRSQEMNRAEAIDRLRQLIQGVMVVAAKRTATKPSRSARQKRLDGKTRHGQIKALRGKVQS